MNRLDGTGFCPKHDFSHHKTTKFYFRGINNLIICWFNGKYFEIFQVNFLVSRRARDLVQSRFASCEFNGFQDRCAGALPALS